MIHIISNPFSPWIWTEHVPVWLGASERLRDLPVRCSISGTERGGESHCRCHMYLWGSFRCLHGQWPYEKTHTHTFWSFEYSHGTWMNMAQFHDFHWDDPSIKNWPCAVENLQVGIVPKGTHAQAVPDSTVSGMCFRWLPWAEFCCGWLRNPAPKGWLKPYKSLNHPDGINH